MVIIDNSWDLCQPFLYQTLPAGGVAINPGSDLIVHLTAAGVDTATEIFLNSFINLDASDELVLFRVAAGHTNGGIEAYLRWGNGAPDSSTDSDG